MGRGEDPRPHARAALRVGRLRGHPRLQDRSRRGRLSPHRAPRAPASLGQAVLHGASVHGRRARPGDARRDQGQRARGLLHPPAGLPRVRRDGPLPAARAGRRGHRRVALGRLPRRRRRQARHPRQGVELPGPRAHAARARGQGHRAVPQQHPRQGRGHERRLRRGDHARRRRARVRGLGREPLPRPRRRPVHAVPDRRRARGHHPRHGAAHRRRRGHRGARAHAGAQRPRDRRRALLHRHGGGDRPHPRGRRPRSSASRARSRGASSSVTATSSRVATRRSRTSSTTWTAERPSDARGDGHDARGEHDGPACPGLRHDAARRHAAGGHVGLGRREGAHRPQARRARHALHRGRFPGLEPQGGGVLRAHGAASAWRTPSWSPSA